VGRAPLQKDDDRGPGDPASGLTLRRRRTDQGAEIHSAETETAGDQQRPAIELQMIRHAARHRGTSLTRTIRWQLFLEPQPTAAQLTAADPLGK
jgi:hypothetical protein